jgi:hypothetical protein
VRIRGYFSKSNGVREKVSLVNTARNNGSTVNVFSIAFAQTGDEHWKEIIFFDFKLPLRS